MEEERNIGKIFYQNGFEFTDFRTFMREAEDANLDELLERLLDLEKKMNSSSEIKDLAGDVGEKLADIEKIVEGDSYFDLTDAMARGEFNHQVKAIKDKFHYARRLLDAEMAWKQEQENYEKTILSISQKGLKLNRDSSIFGEEKNEQFSNLLNEKKAAVKAHSDALKNYNRCKEEYEKSKENFDLTKFKNDLLASVNKLEDILKRAVLDQSKDESSKSKIDFILEDIMKMREAIVIYGLESTRSRSEFDELCKRFGIVYNKDIKDIKEREEAQEVVEEKPLPEKEIAEETPQKNDVEKVFEELKKLNPNVEFTYVGKAVSPKYDGRIESSEPVSRLFLPDGFYYINGGITNRFSSDANPVLVEIGSLKREEKLQEEPNVEPEIGKNEEIKKDFFATEEPSKEKEPLIEETPIKEEPSIQEDTKESLFKRAKDAISKLSATSRISPNTKYRVTKVRRAVIGPYPKTFLTFSALTAVTTAIAGVPGLAAIAVGGGIGVIAQALYDKVTKGTRIKVKALEEAKDKTAPEQAPELVEALREGSDELMNIYKKRKNGELQQDNTKQVDLDQVEQLDDLEEGLRRSLAEFDEKKDDILADELVGSGR